MKRRKASTKMTNVVHAGWMTKSPPERKLNAPFKIFRSQWKKRYFVLRKPQGSLPDQYELHYYKNESCNSKKGTIDLEQCEQIIEALDSDQFPYLLAIKTYCKNKVRTYYLAAESEQEMNTWVQWLCHVCALKPEDQPTDIPDPKPQPNPASSNQAAIPNGQPASQPSHGGGTSSGAAGAAASSLSTSPQTAGAAAVVSSQPRGRTSSSSSLGSYIPLVNCTTGQPQPADRRESVESVPDFLAPSPPQKRQGNQNSTTLAGDDDVFAPPLYDHPPQSVDRDSGLYQVPPARPSRGDRFGDNSYDIPPSHPSRSSHPGLSASDTVSGPSECYDYPPPRLDSTTSSDSEIPPERPPKPSHLQSPYQNLPLANKDPDLMTTIPAPKAHSVKHGSGYDVPRSSTRPNTQRPALSFVTSAPPRPPRQSQSSGHNYLNTQQRPDSGEMGLACKDGSENGATDKDVTSLDLTDGGAVPPIAPPPRLGSSGEPQDGRSASPHSLYQTPPPSSASSSSPGAPARPPERTPAKGPSISPRSYDGNSSQADDGGVIFSTQRTRSFKRHHNINNNSPKMSHKSSTLPMSAPVPAPRPVLPSKPKTMSASDDSGDGRLSEEETHHPLSLLRSVPPPSSDNEGELKYIDLALPNAGQDTPRLPHGHGHGHGHSHTHPHSHIDRSKDSATEYREIDFVKTQALNDTKKVKEKERKNDDHN